MRVVGVVGREYKGGAEVPVTYFNPVTDQRLTVDTYVWHVDLPRAGSLVNLEVDRDDPGNVVLEGDRFTVAENLPFSVIWPLLPLTAGALRRWGLARSRRVLEGTTSFVMLGALTSPWRLGRYCHLQLYALDAPPGAAPVCTVPVLLTHGFPIPSGAFEVDVKGIPRPTGRVVARAGDRVFWPAGRALTTSTAPRPVEITPAEPVALREVDRPEVARARFPWPALTREAIACGGAAVLAFVVAGVTFEGARDARSQVTASVPTIGKVVEADADEYHVVVEFRDPTSGEVRRDNAPADWPDDHPVGRRYPILVGPSGVRLAREPYDAEEPIAWAATPLVMTSLLLLRRALLVRANLRTLDSGPFFDAAAWRLGDGEGRTRVGLGVPGQALRATTMLATDEVGLGRYVVVAGDATPGAPTALVIEGRAVVPLGPCTAPPKPPSP